MIIISAIFFFILALLLALIEIESEGKYGWAEKAQTWYRKSKFWGFFFQGKPLTGYHLCLFPFILLAFHTGFFLGLPWTIGKELSILALYFLFSPTWDFLWFVLNPNYTIKNFRKNKVWWFSESRWILNLFPADYLYAVIISFIFAFFANNFINNFIIFITFLALTFITIILSPLYHKWYKNMRKRDDRKRFI